jgi:cbb3-type cytochrome oxidase subunit 3
MLRTLLGNNDLNLWPQLSLIIFMICFAAILLRVFSRKNRPHYDYMARLTVDEGVNTHTEKNHG